MNEIKPVFGKKPGWVVEPGDPFGIEIGFTTDRFSGYLSRVGDVVWISAIFSLQPGKGNFSRLVNECLRRGYMVKIPNPFPHMQRIAAHLRFMQTYEDDSYYGLSEVWVKDAKKRRNTKSDPESSDIAKQPFNDMEEGKA